MGSRNSIINNKKRKKCIMRDHLRGRGGWKERSTHGCQTFFQHRTEKEPFRLGADGEDASDDKDNSENSGPPINQSTAGDVHRSLEGLHQRTSWTWTADAANGQRQRRRSATTTKKTIGDHEGDDDVSNRGGGR